MRKLQSSLLALFVALGVSCGGDVESDDERHPVVPPQNGTYTIDFSRYEGDDPPTPLHVRNETLIFALARSPLHQQPTREDPGDELIAYTRLTCSGVLGMPPLEGTIDPSNGEQSFGRDGPFLHLTRIAIEQLIEDVVEAERLGDATCFTYRTHDGVWNTIVAPTSVTVEGNLATSTITLDAREVDLIAIYLQSGANVRSVAYDVTID
jgi:hypothetical protein